MNFFSRHKNTLVLAVVLLVQLLALAVQVKRQTAEGPVRVIRLVAVNSVAPFERFFIYTGGGMRAIWSNYIDLRNVRSENIRLKAEFEQVRLDRAREQEDARQARRIQALLGFKEKWIDSTVAAQVIGTSGTESSRLLYLNKGASDGIKQDMPVITPDGVVGKILTVYGDTAQVLMISDPTSGLAATLVNSRLQGIIKGSSTGRVQLNYIMGDETVKPGEALITSGGDRIFPKGLPIGVVSQVSMGRNLFLDIKVKPAANLDRLEEVLVITEQKWRAPDTAGLGPIRASDILAQHLPGVPEPPQVAASQQAGQVAPVNQPAQSPHAPAATQKPPVVKPAVVKPVVKPAVKPAIKPAIKPAAVAVPAKDANGQKPKARVPAAGNNGGAGAAARNPVQKPAVPKTIAAKQVTPNASGAKPKAAAIEGAHPE